MNSWRIFLAFLLLETCHGQDQHCNDALQKILDNNRPQTLVIPDTDEANAFMSSQVRVSVSWAHIDDLLFDAGLKEAAAWDSYFIEYSTLSSSTQLTKASDGGGGKEHVFHTPVINDGTSQYSFTIPDDCEVYSVVLGVVVNASQAATCPKIVYSQAKLLWPAARHTTVNIFSNRAEFFWPPGCHHLILPTWQMEACTSLAPESLQNCRRDSLRSASETSKYEVTNLDPCQLWNFRLRASPSVSNGVIKLGSILWTFEATTVPIPHIQAIAGHDYLRLILDQSKCSTEAIISDWRVTVCDDLSVRNDSNNCRNALHRLAFFSRQKHISRGYLEVRPLKDCQLYTVAISPATIDGSPILPGEKYTSIHSTLCSSSHSVNDDEEQSTTVGSKSSNSELVVVLITMILIGSAMLCLALKSVTSLSSGTTPRHLSSKPYYNPASGSYYDEYGLQER